MSILDVIGQVEARITAVTALLAVDVSDDIKLIDSVITDTGTLLSTLKSQASDLVSAASSSSASTASTTATTSASS